MLNFLMLPLTAVLAVMIITAHLLYRRRVLPALNGAGHDAAVQREPAGYWAQIAAYGEWCRAHGTSLAAWRFLSWVPRLSVVLLIAWFLIGVLSPA